MIALLQAFDWEELEKVEVGGHRRIKGEVQQKLCRRSVRSQKRKTRRFAVACGWRGQTGAKASFSDCELAFGDFGTQRVLETSDDGMLMCPIP